MQNRYKLWMILSLVVAFGAGLLGGVCSERYYFHSRRHAEMARQRAGSHFPSLEQFSRELGLSAGQQEQIKKIFEDHEAQLKELRADMNGRLGTIRSELKAKIDTVLTPEQKAKLEVRMKEHIEQKKREAERRRSGPDGERPQDKPTGERQ